jgi:hypothetical protein
VTSLTAWTVRGRETIHILSFIKWLHAYADPEKSGSIDPRRRPSGSAYGNSEKLTSHPFCWRFRALLAASPVRHAQMRCTHEKSS